MIPEIIILNAGDAIAEFKSFVISTNDWEGSVDWFVNYIVSHVVGCIDTERRGEYELREFAAMIEFGEYANDETSHGIKEHYADSFLALGLSIFKQVRELGLYRETGEMLHVYYDETPEHFNDVVLSNIVY